MPSPPWFQHNHNLMATTGLGAILSRTEMASHSSNPPAQNREIRRRQVTEFVMQRFMLTFTRCAPVRHHHALRRRPRVEQGARLHQCLFLPSWCPMLVPVPRYGNGICRSFEWLGFLSVMNSALSIKASSRDFYIESALPAFEPLPSRSRPAPDSCARSSSLWRLGNHTM